MAQRGGKGEEGRALRFELKKEKGKGGSKHLLTYVSLEKRKRREREKDASVERDFAGGGEGKERDNAA